MGLRVMNAPERFIVEDVGGRRSNGSEMEQAEPLCGPEPGNGVWDRCYGWADERGYDQHRHPSPD